MPFNIKASGQEEGWGSPLVGACFAEELVCSHGRREKFSTTSVETKPKANNKPPLSFLKPSLNVLH